MECKLMSLIQSIGYELKDNDLVIIDFCIEKAENRVKNQTNQAVIPEGLDSVTVDIALGEFLKFKKDSGQLDISSLDFSDIKGIKEGDTSLDFGSNDSTRMDGLISWLISGKGCDFACYRKIKW